MKTKRIPIHTVTSCRNPPCGACCTEQAALPVSWYLGMVSVGQHSVVLGESADSLPAGLRAELEAMLATFMATGFPPDGSPCVWFDAETRLCRHYEYRPSLCREAVKVGDESCHRWRRIVGIEPTRQWGVVKGKVKEFVS